MKIYEMSIYDIKAYENNPRKIPERAVEAVASSIKNFGFINPVVIDRGNVIVCGHTRLQAAKRLGIQEVSCVIVDDLTPEQVQAFRVIDNKTSELTTWDFDKLDTELEELNLNFDMGEFGFEDIEPVDINSFFEDIPEQQTKQGKCITCPECGAKFNA